MCAHICTLTDICMPAKMYKQVCTYYKYACCHTHALEVIANNGCQLGSRCIRQHNWAQVDCFFNWVGGGQRRNGRRVNEKKYVWESG